MLAYESEENIGKDIARRILHAKPGGSGNLKQIFITTDLQNVGGALLQYRGTISQLKQLDREYRATIKEATNQITPPASPSTNPTNELLNAQGTGGLISSPVTLADVISAFNTLVGFVSTTTTLNGVSVTSDEMGVIPVITESLHQAKGGIDASYVNLFVDTSYVSNSESLFYLLNKALGLRAMGQAVTNRIGMIVQAMPAPATNAPDNRFNQLPAKLQNDYMILSALNGQFDNLAATLLNSNMLSSFAVADFYENNVKGRSANALLYVKLLYAGGDNRIKSNPFINLFTDGPRYSYAGGAVMAYLMVDSTGKTVLSGVARELVGYEKIDTQHSFGPFTKGINGNLKSGR